MRGSSSGVVSIPGLLVLAGVIMLGVGFGMLFGTRTVLEAGTAAAESLLVEPVSGVLSEVENPVAGPGSQPETHDPQLRAWLRLIRSLCCPLGCASRASRLTPGLSI